MNKPQSKGIVISGGSDNVAYGNTVVGYDIGVEIDGGVRNRADANIVLSTEAAQIYADLEAAIRSSDIREAERERLLAFAQELKNSTGTPGFVQNYKAFMAVLSDHMQILGPVVGPLLPALSGLLPG